MPTPSNYPPGVTGFEPQIAGYPERVRHVTCDRQDAEWMSAAAVHRLVASVRRRSNDTDARVSELLDAARDTRDRGEAESYRRVDSLRAAERHFVRSAVALIDGVEVVDRPCTFDGRVDGYVDPVGRSFSWTCPECGTEHEDEEVDDV